MTFLKGGGPTETRLWNSRMFLAEITAALPYHASGSNFSLLEPFFRFGTVAGFRYAAFALNSFSA